jgi:hypothetical protein
MATKKSIEASLKLVFLSAVRAAEDLESLGAEVALIGGLAIGARGEPRFTRDVDIAVAVSRDEQAEELIYGLTARGYRLDTLIEQTRTGRLATARLQHRDAPRIYVDLLFASSGIEQELARAAQIVRLRVGVELPVARVGHLIALKVLSESEKRLQDRIDIQELAKVATAEDWKTAEAMVRLIKERGFHRGRALVTRLRRFRRAHA